MHSKVVASILHGAYGDYYEQAVCLKHFRSSHPDVRMKLFAAAPTRLAELRVLDFSWADCFEMYTELANHRVDEFFQFQAQDWELQKDVLSKLPPELAGRMDPHNNRLPWRFLRKILPLNPAEQLGLSEAGQKMLPAVMRENGIPPDVFQRPTIGFLWRYRTHGGAIKGNQTDPLTLAAKYSRLFRRLIDSYGCHILICGMKVPRTAENRRRIDAKFPEYGLDLPPESSTHLKGLSWALELEILSRCAVCVANPSGFSEALWIKRGAGVLLVDPSLHYLAKALRHRMPFFNLRRPASLLSVMASGWEGACLAAIRAEMDRSQRQSPNRSFGHVQDLAS
jgi:hypothetical protein